MLLEAPTLAVSAAAPHLITIRFEHGGIIFKARLALVHDEGFMLRKFAISYISFLALVTRSMRHLRGSSDVVLPSACL